MITRPLKAPSRPLTKEEIATLQFPVWASLKKDGIRGLTHPTLGLVSGKFLPIPNHYIRETVNSWKVPNLDGEIVIPGASFNENQSIIMSKQHPRQKEFQFLVFDCFEYPMWSYINRMVKTQTICNDTNCSELKFLSQWAIENSSMLNEYEENAVSQGEEGIMIRRADGRDYYKCGRSTLREAFLLKIVRHVRDEAKVVGLIEQQVNCNIATYDNLGLAKRSKHQDNLIGKNTLGAFLVEYRGHRMRIGTGEGLTDHLRKQIWTNPYDYIGKTITFKYKPHNMKDLPRQPIFTGFRYD
jgi:DNA ligase-1